MPKCIVCGNPAAEFEPYWGVLRKCRHCGHCVADLDVETLDLGSLYNETYFSGGDYADYLRDRAVFEKHFSERLGEVRRSSPGKDLVEVGCGYGFFLSVASRYFRATGYDIAEGPVRYARDVLGVDARCEDFVTAPVASASADVIVIWDTIEHLARPDLVVAKASQVLKPGGMLFLTTGDIGSILARMRKRRWRLVTLPSHLHYFTKKTLSRLLSNAGLVPVSAKYVGVRRSLRQVAYRLFAFGRQRRSGLYERIADSRIGELSFRLNMFDIFLMAARKPPR